MAPQTDSGRSPSAWVPSTTTPAIDTGAIIAAFNLPPERAIEWLEQRGLAVTWDWRDDWRVAREMAFSVRKVQDTQVLATIREEVARAMREGISQADFRRYLSGRLTALGWYQSREVVAPDGTRSTVDLSLPHRQDVIFRTNGQAALMAGRYDAQVAAAQAGAAPFWQYVAILDSRTRPTHRAMNGRVYRWDDPIWRTIYPPNGFNCRCRVRTLTAADVDARGLRVLDSAQGSAGLPDGFPDGGFDYNPGIPGAGAAALAASQARATQRAMSARAPT